MSCASASARATGMRGRSSCWRCRRKGRSPYGSPGLVGFDQPRDECQRLPIALPPKARRGPPSAWRRTPGRSPGRRNGPGHHHVLPVVDAPFDIGDRDPPLGALAIALNLGCHRVGVALALECGLVLSIDPEASASSTSSRSTLVSARTCGEVIAKPTTVASTIASAGRFVHAWCPSRSVLISLAERGVNVDG